MNTSCQSIADLIHHSEHSMLTPRQVRAVRNSHHIAHKKLDIMPRCLNENEHLLTKIAELENLANTSIKDAARYGEIIRFIKEVTSVADYERLFAVFSNYMINQGLSTSIYITDDTNELTRDQNGLPCTSAELNVFQLLRDGRRLYEFGNRLIVNDRHVSFLIKNLPFDDEERGQIRDYVAVIIECLEEKVKSIRQSESIWLAAHDLAEITRDTLDTMQRSKAVRRAIIEKVCHDISMSFHSLDLSLDQENHLTDIIRDALDASEDEDIVVNAAVERIGSVADTLESLSKFDIKNESNQSAETELAVELF